MEHQIIWRTTIDGYDARNFSEDNYKIVSGKYDQISGIFGFDDRTPSKASTDLVILQDGKEVYRTSINEKQLSKKVDIKISPDTKFITIRFEIKGEIKNRIPMIIFADIKARGIQ